MDISHSRAFPNTGRVRTIVASGSDAIQLDLEKSVAVNSQGV